jgi:hypothetical protein
LRSAEIGPYRVLRLIKRGGAGTVYVAHDQRLNRRVALKLIPVPADKERRKAIVGEARSLARLNHRSIVQIFDVVETRTHIVLVMEYVPGTDLQSLYEQSELSLHAVLQMGMDVCAALGAAHQVRIVHRDLKPGNILIDPSGRIKLTDFGISQTLAPVTGDPEGPESVVPGSYLAMSPEHAAGAKLDERTDIYALGLLLYRCLGGKHPFADADNETELLHQLQHAQPPPLESCQRPVPAALCTLVDRVLNKDPRLRPASALQIRQSLLAILRSLPLTQGAALADIVVGHTREEDQHEPPVNLPAGVARGARSRLLSTGEWGPWSMAVRAMAGKTAIALVIFSTVTGGWHLGQTWWSQRDIEVLLMPALVLGSSAIGQLPNAVELGGMLESVVREMPDLVAVKDGNPEKIFTRVRCNDYLCELQLIRERVGHSVFDYTTLLPDVPPRVWQAKLSEGLGRLYLE